jgi:putative glutamine amidotransferase
MIAAAGAVPIILTPDMLVSDIIELCDGIVISGGEDIPAEVYDGQSLLTVPEPLERIMWERVIIDACADSSVPILGICYGMQLMAIHYGGSLYQDIPTEVPGSIAHVSTVHEVAIEDEFLGLMRGEKILVASRHHQAIAALPDDFTLCAKAPDGVIEAIKYRYFYGVQWHPESHESGVTMYAAFVELCRQQSTQNLK